MTRPNVPVPPTANRARRLRLIAACCGLSVMGSLPILGGTAEAPAEPLLTRGTVLAALKPYTGPSVPGVDTSTLTGKVVCGYQGWFGTPTDGAGRGWVHWSRDRDACRSDTATFDLWPDLTDFPADERDPTEFTIPDGRPAEVFSSYRKPTVLRHFEWMREYGIDGAFVQRFAVGLRSPHSLRHVNAVLDHCREGANRNGRGYAVMYDLTGLGGGRIDEVIDDWRELRARMKLTDDPAYLRHGGRPVVAVWGVGFNDGRAYTLAECRRLVEFLKGDSAAGGCCVVLGVPAHWRDLHRDAVTDPELHKVLAAADILSPWTVGRYRTPAAAAEYAERVLKPDLEWCRERKLECLPVAFPGFSWHNLKLTPPVDEIPRRKGEFLWVQFAAAKRAGADMVYVAMFDEVDEGTAVFKCTNAVPAGGPNRFATFDGLPSDYYLRLTGAGGKLIRGDIPADAPRPTP